MDLLGPILSILLTQMPAIRQPASDWELPPLLSRQGPQAHRIEARAGGAASPSEVTGIFRHRGRHALELQLTARTSASGTPVWIRVLERDPAMLGPAGLPTAEANATTWTMLASASGVDGLPAATLTIALEPSRDVRIEVGHVRPGHHGEIELRAVETPPLPASPSASAAQTLVPDSPDLTRELERLTALLQRADGALRAGDPATARSAIEEAVKGATAEWMRNSRRGLAIGRSLAALAIAAGVESTTIALHDFVLQALEDAVPEHDPDLAIARFNVGQNRMFDGDFVGARPLLAAATIAYERLRPEDDEEVVDAWDSLANVLRQLGDVRGAIALQRRVVRAMDGEGGGDPVREFGARVNLVSTLAAARSVASTQPYTWQLRSPLGCTRRNRCRGRWTREAVTGRARHRSRGDVADRRRCLRRAPQAGAAAARLPAPRHPWLLPSRWARVDRGHIHGAARRRTRPIPVRRAPADRRLLSLHSLRLGPRRRKRARHGAAAGHGAMSLARSFRDAGARTVISSLRSVRDDSTRELMLDFYDRLWNKGESKLDALRNAEFALLRRNREKYGDTLPATWGAFVLTGEWE
ncbi:MAG: CHAT domain-containing protein [Planctomycetes bacterium]|nr:CHAT domain-containing protein [Planctomycetota bacterium]